MWGTTLPPLKKTSTMFLVSLICTLTSTGITRFNYYAEKQKNMQEMAAQQREREQQAEALYSVAETDKNIEATTPEA